MFFKFVSEKLKTISSSTSDKFISWGCDNLEPQKLLSFLNFSPEHNTAIDFNTDLIIGNGLNIKDLPFNTVKKIINDYLLFGGFALQILKKRNGEKTYEYIKIENTRKTEGGKVAYSENFDEYNCKIKTVNLSDGSTDGIFLYYNSKTRDIYPKPYYFSTELSLDTMSEILKYHNNNAKNGFSPSFIVNYNSGIPEPDDQAVIKAGFQDNFTGSQGQKIIVAFNKDKESAITIEKIESDNLDEKFETLQKFIQNQIVIAHKLPSGCLIGIRPENQGFSKTEYDEALSIHKEVSINSFRKELESVLSGLFNTEVKFQDVTNNSNN